MSCRKLLQQMIGATLIILLVVGCGTPAATSVSEAPAATSTPVPLAATPTPIPSSISISGVITNLDEARQYLGEDSYLQLVSLPADGRVAFATDEQGRLAYVSELAKIPIPDEGVFTFQVEDLEPGTYIVAAQQFLNVPGSTPILVREAEFVTIMIPQHANLPLSFDLGEVAIYIP